jgi:hypothetical protein
LFIVGHGGTCTVGFVRCGGSPNIIDMVMEDVLDLDMDKYFTTL